MNEISGWIGAALLLGAYAAHSCGFVLSTSAGLHTLNLSGASLLAINAANHGAKPVMVLNIIWALLAASQIIRRYFEEFPGVKKLSPIIDFIFQGLPKTDEDFQKLAEAQRRNQSATNPDKDLINHYYASLSAIDSKSGALLTNNSLWLAVLAIFSTSESIGFDKQSPWELVTALLSFLFILTSSSLALFTIYARWSSASELDNPALLSDTLLRVRAARTKYFRLAAISSAFGFSILAVFVCSKYLMHLCGLRWS